jgi:UDP-3-O-[3-hydroxymyristoyl] glucosamine N-acyltransferase
MKQYELQQVLDNIKEDYILKGSKTNKLINNASTPQLADSKSLIWIKPNNKNSSLITSTLAKIIICDKYLFLPKVALKNKCFIIVENPKLTFLRLVSLFFTLKKDYNIHSSAVINPNAKIHKQVGIGANTLIGNSIIGKGTIISCNCYIGDNVKIGKNVFIKPGVVIGTDGFGYSRNKEGIWEKFPHLGGVLIEDNVDIGANSCIDRGTLGNTIIHEGSKIDNLVHIGHNVIIGKNSLIIANTMIGGSTEIGEGCWVSPSANIMNGIKIGNNVTISMASWVTKNIPDEEIWAGFPAQPINDFMALQRRFKKRKV